MSNWRRSLPLPLAIVRTCMSVSLVLRIAMVDEQAGSVQRQELSATGRVGKRGLSLLHAASELASGRGKFSDLPTCCVSNALRYRPENVGSASSESGACGVPIRCCSTDLPLIRVEQPATFDLSISQASRSRAPAQQT